jgi:hypothetical protein
MANSSILPEDRWIFLCKDRTQDTSGMWLYICGDTSKTGGNQEKLSSINDSHVETESIKDPQLISTKKLNHSILTDINIESSSNSMDMQEDITTDKYRKSPSPVLPIMKPINVANELSINNPVASLVMPQLQEVPDPIIPEVRELVQSLVDQVVIEEIKTTITPTSGLNTPYNHEPIIEISSPLMNPEKNKAKRRKIVATEYDPENPSMNHRPFQCEDCPKSFKLKGTLERHVQSNHRNENYKCDECGKKLLRKDSVRRHYKLHHKGVQLPEFLVIDSTNTSKPSKVVKFNLKSKTSDNTTVPVSQFASSSQSNMNNDSSTSTNMITPEAPNDLLKQILATLQSYK